VSLVAVTLCTAMVLVVISVMGGWLRMFRETNHSIVGDVIVYRQSLDGFPYYEEMIEKIRALPEVKAAAPQIHSYALISMNNVRFGVQVTGYDLAQIKDVNGFMNSLHQQPKELEEMAEKKAAEGNVADAAALRAKARPEAFASWQKPLSDDTYRSISMRGHPGDVAAWPGIIVGTGVILQGDKDGKIVRPDFMYETYATLTVLNVSETARAGLNMDSTSPRNYWLIDDSHTGVFAADETMVYVPFAILQKDLKMDPQPLVDPVTGAAAGSDPARCNEIQISLKDRVNPDLVQPKVEKIVQSIAGSHDLYYGKDPIRVETWETRLAPVLSAVEHEKVLLVILFAIISVVAVFLIFCIFYMIVVEKTRDIGIIKSVGATGVGVAGIFLGYGLVIGLIGGGMGLLFGYLIVHNINWLHGKLALLLGVPIWDAKTYVFDTIPNTMETKDVVVIVSIAILSSVLGAVVPAMRAARLSPVEALRWE
jgi:lipoprotein-releasing system permease protein